MKKFEKKIFANRLQKAIDDRKISKISLSNKIDVDKADITRFTSYKSKRLPNYAKLFEICNILGITSDYLIGLSDSENAENAENVNVAQVTGLSPESVANLRCSSAEYQKAYVNTFSLFVV